jgi:hypothetical protein
MNIGAAQVAIRTYRNAPVKVGTRKAMQQQRKHNTMLPRLSFGAISAEVDKHQSDHTSTPEILEELARAHAAVATSVPDPGRLG